jgi:hypothetical protein
MLSQSIVLALSYTNVYLMKLMNRVWPCETSYNDAAKDSSDGVQVYWTSYLCFLGKAQLEDSGSTLDRKFFCTIIN